LPSSKPVHLDLKVMGDLVRMRGRGDSGPKLGGAATFSGHCAAAQALSGNGGKWRPLGRRSALYNRAQRRNGWSRLEVYSARITASQQSGTLNGSIAQRLFLA
jgi:hypothetical protein